MSAFNVCKRMGYLKYIEKYDLREDKGFRLRGTLIHLAMAYLYASKMEKPPSWFYEKDLDTALLERGVGLPDGIQRAKEVLYAYQQEFAIDSWVPFTMEEEFAATIGELDPGGPDSTLDSEEVTCRPDLIVKVGDELWIVDHKSKGKGYMKNGRYYEGLEPWDDDGEFALNWQVMVNLQIVRARLQTPVAGFIIQRMTREPDSRGHFHFDRHNLIVPARAYAEAPRAMRDCVSIERRVRADAAQGIAPAPSYWACDTKWGHCDFRNVCKAGSSEQRHSILNHDFVRSN